MGDKEAAQRVAGAVRKKITKGELNLEAQKKRTLFWDIRTNS